MKNTQFLEIQKKVQIREFFTGIPDFRNLRQDFRKDKENWKGKTLCIDVLNVLLRKVNIREEICELRQSQANKTMFEYIIVDHKFKKPQKLMSINDLVRYNQKHKAKIEEIINNFSEN